MQYGRHKLTMLLPANAHACKRGTKRLRFKYSSKELLNCCSNRKKLELAFEFAVSKSKESYKQQNNKYHKRQITD